MPRTAPGVAFFHTPQIQKSLERILYIWGIRCAAELVWPVKPERTRAQPAPEGAAAALYISVCSSVRPLRLRVPAFVYTLRTFIPPEG